MCYCQQCWILGLGVLLTADAAGGVIGGTDDSEMGASVVSLSVCCAGWL